jgi:hypothetical protein
MDESTYATIPSTLRLRLILVEVHEPGFRVQKLLVVTTLLDAERYPTQSLAQLYHYRWNAEVCQPEYASSLRLYQLAA